MKEEKTSQESEEIGILKAICYRIRNVEQRLDDLPDGDAIEVRLAKLEEMLLIILSESQG